MSRPSTLKPTAGRAAEGIDRTMQGVYRRLPENIRLLMAKYDIDPATLMYGEIVPVDMSGITISA